METETIIKETKILDVVLNPLHLACCDDDLRPNGSLIEIRKGTATCTNFHIMVKFDLLKTMPFTKDMVELLEGKFIHKEVWKEMCKCDELEFDDQFIYVTKTGIKKMFEYSNSQGSFFNIDDIIQPLKEYGQNELGCIGYNPKLITIIGKVFKEDKLYFSFTSAEKGTIVYPFNDSGMFAVLMPITDIEPRYLFF